MKCLFFFLVSALTASGFDAFFIDGRLYPSEGVVLPHCEEGYRAVNVEQSVVEGAAVFAWDCELIVDPIPPEGLLQIASAFRHILREHFGEEAETNTDVTANAVAAYFINRRLTNTGEATDGQDAFFLQTGFEQITAWTGDGTVWSFPWHLLEE